MISDNHTRELKYLEKLRKSQLSSWQVTPNTVFAFLFFFSFLSWAVEEDGLGSSHQSFVGKESKSQLSVPLKCRAWGLDWSTGMM